MSRLTIFFRSFMLFFPLLCPSLLHGLFLIKSFINLSFFFFFEKYILNYNEMYKTLCLKYGYKILLSLFGKGIYTHLHLFQDIFKHSWNILTTSNFCQLLNFLAWNLLAHLYASVRQAKEINALFSLCPSTIVLLSLGRLVPVWAPSARLPTAGAV